MSQELLYTSAPHGLKPGSRGFCTVLSTQGMAAPLASALEGLSGYRPAYPPGDEQTDLNPINWSHVTLPVAGRTWHILSRIAEYGLDYSQRTNKLAHHVVLDSAELITAGPAALLANPGFMRDEWNEDPHLAPPKPVHKIPPLPRGVCQAWKDLTGDAGWAGVLAESFMRDPERPVILLYAPGQDMLPLIAEALSLIPADRRWEVTFSTYFTGLPQSVTCNWRCMLNGSAEAHQSLRFVRALRLDLSNPDTLGIPAGNELVAAARGMPRMKANIAGNLPPLPTEVKEAVGYDHLDLATNDELRSDELPPLPWRNVYQTQPPPSPPSERGLRKSTVPSNDAEVFNWRRKRALVLGTAGIIILSLICLGVSAGRTFRTNSNRRLVDGITEIPSSGPKELVRELPSKSSVTSPSKSTGAAPVPKTNKPVEKNLVSSTATSIQKSVLTSELGPNNTPQKSDVPTVNILEIPRHDKKVPAEIDASLATLGNQTKELWTRRETSNPFLSVKLFSPELTYLAGTVKNAGQAIRLDLKVTGTTTGVAFAKIMSNAPEEQFAMQPFDYKLTLIPSSNTKDIERLRWCELDVQNKDSTPAITHIKFHPFPLARGTQEVAFYSKDDGALESKWNLKVVAETNVPQMLMTRVQVQIGAVNYRFVFSKQTNGDNGNLISSFRCDELNLRATKVLPTVKENYLSEALAITMQTEASSRDEVSLKPVAVILKMNARSKLKKELAVDSKMRENAKKSCENAIRSLTDVRQNVDTKCIREIYKSATTNEILSAVNELKRHQGQLPKIQVQNVNARKLVMIATEATSKAINELNDLMNRVTEWTEFEDSLKQCRIMSADLHYQIKASDPEVRNVFIYRIAD